MRCSESAGIGTKSKRCRPIASLPLSVRPDAPTCPLGSELPRWAAHCPRPSPVWRTGVAPTAVYLGHGFASPNPRLGLDGNLSVRWSPDCEGWIRRSPWSERDHGHYVRHDCQTSAFVLSRGHMSSRTTTRLPISANSIEPIEQLRHLIRDGATANVHGRLPATPPDPRSTLPLLSLILGCARTPPVAFVKAASHFKELHSNDQPEPTTAAHLESLLRAFESRITHSGLQELLDPEFLGDTQMPTS